MTPLSAYQAAIEDKQIQPDPAQKKAIEALQTIFMQLVDQHQQLHADVSFFDQIKNRFVSQQMKAIEGLYFWGGVGRGKTYLVDLFYECLPFDEKMRMHFHRFMQMVHSKLKRLNDVEDPLQIIAEDIASKHHVICFDEFHVADITDAMLLAGLFAGLFNRGVTLIATSNQLPDDLYAGGLQRERFLPAIDLIKQHTKVINIDSGTDYRLQFLDRAEIYHSPLDDNALAMLQTNFDHIAPDVGERNQSIEIADRSIETVYIADGVVWFEFNALCDGPRGAADYIEIARCFQTVLLANVPSMDDLMVDKAKRFMTLVDEFYDRNVKLIMTAECQAESLYSGHRLNESFKRTSSRLNEMASHDYLAKQHLP